ncbi:MAG: hypothetical protein KDC88_09945, partial [Ignavibacteriae bacterium]|nr:hypothetical protein [Ignavibacteriota bacterium]
MNISLKILNIFKFRSQLVLTFAFSLFTFSSSFSAPQIYLIDPSGSGDYKSITEAIDDLYSSLPISNEIIYKIASGNYEEQLIFNGPITGGNATNTITFASAADDSTQVNIGTNAGNVIEIDNAQFITFSKLTFTAPSNARIINSTNCEGYLTFTNNIFNGVSSGNDDIINLISGNGQSLDNINISGNIFNNGNDGINLTSVNIGQNLDIANNIFSTKNRAIVCTNFNSPDILSNTITNNSNDFALWLIGNTNYSIAKNKINTTTDLGSGIYINNPNSGTTYDNGTIVNNFIQASNIGLSLDELVSVDIFFNTINIENFPLSTKSTSYAVYSTSADLDIKNNIFHNNRNGKSFRFQNDPSNQNDYNVLFTNGITLGEYSTTPITSLSDLHSESGMDFNSKQAEILFNSLSNLHLSGISQTIYGTQITSITTDIDGESRNNPPIIGADEYKPNPITNDKLIGASGDYNTIKEAMCDLYLNGIDNAVTFYILDGSYIDQINFSENIPGSSASNIFTLQSESNNPKNVEINYTASDSLRNFVIKINEAQYIKIKNLTLTADGTSFAKVVWLENDCNNLEFYGNIFNGYEITNGLASEEQNVFSCIDSSVLINTAILNNEFNNGSSGIMLLLNNNTKPHGIVINNNIIQDNYSGVNIYNADSPIISYNTISNNQYSYILSLYECIDTLTIESNKINGKNGVNISQCNGTDLLRGKINNNFITPNLYIMNSSFIEINHNSIQSFGASYSNSRVFELDYKNIYTGTLENLNIYNNIFNNIQDGYAYYTDGGSNISSNYNNLFTTGEYIGFADGADTPLLTDFRNASGTDANS